jgi:copper transport protein
MRIRRAVVAAAAAVVTGVALAAPASAHATLASSDPPANAVLSKAPGRIDLRFDEAVEISLGAVRLFDGRGHEVDVGRPLHPAGDSRSVEVSVPDVGQGSYVVAWRVVSADSHPVRGAYTFQVGTGATPAQTGLVARLLANQGGNAAAGLWLGVARFLAYAGLAVVMGGLAVLAALWPDGVRQTQVRRALWIGLGAALIGSLAAVALQAPYASGRSLSDALVPARWGDVVSTRAGGALARRAALLAVVGTGLLLTLRRITTTGWRFAAAVSGLAALALVALAGHGATGRWPLVGAVATVVHVGAMAVWVGGLVVVLIGALRLGDASAALVVVRRFSALAFWAVAVVVLSGVVQAYRQVGSFDALISTTYGRVLVVKTAVVAVLVAVAALARRFLYAEDRAVPLAPVPAAVGAAVLESSPAPGRPGDASRRLRRTIAIEAALAAVVLGVTSLLVASAPAVAERSGPFNTSLVQDQVLASITVDPARQGRNQLHVYLSPPGGSLQKAEEITVRVALPSRDIGPIEVPVQSAGPNHVTTDALDLPVAGTWQLEVLARFGQFDQVRFLTNVPVT